LRWPPHRGGSGRRRLAGGTARRRTEKWRARRGGVARPVHRRAPPHVSASVRWLWCWTGGVAAAGARRRAAAGGRDRGRWREIFEALGCTAGRTDLRLPGHSAGGGGQLLWSAPKSDGLSDSPRGCNVVAPPCAKWRAHSSGSVRHTRAHKVCGGGEVGHRQFSRMHTGRLKARWVTEAPLLV